jgi:hypothetical protein
MTHTTISPRLASAYHEAGHAVASLALGFPFQQVTIVEDEESNGGILHPLYQFQFDMTHRANRSAVRDYLVTVLAGHIAEVRYTCSRNDAGASADDERVDSILWDIYGERSERHRRDLEQRARSLVGQRWSSIQVLAQALLDRHTLTGSEAQHIAGIQLSTS